MKIVIGVTTYGMGELENGFLASFWNNNENTGDEISLVCIDDGTSNPNRVREREAAVKRLHCDFIRNEENLGIPASWNKILHYAKDKGAELSGIFNNDLRFVTPGVLTRVKYFYERNRNVGMIGLPLIQERGFHDADPKWLNSPGKVGAAVGCSFFTPTDIALSVENPDGSKGFFESLLSFHEETTFGFKLNEMDYQSWMLPWPPALHFGGVTFQTNPELIWRDPVPGVSTEHFLEYVRSCQWHIPSYEEAYAQNKFDRMSYSRYLFCLHWGIFDVDRYQEIDGQRVDCWENPQILVHNRVVKKKLDRLIFWLSKSGEEMSVEA